MHIVNNRTSFFKLLFQRNYVLVFHSCSVVKVAESVVVIVLEDLLDDGLDQLSLLLVAQVAIVSVIVVAVTVPVAVPAAVVVPIVVAVVVVVAAVTAAVAAAEAAAASADHNVPVAISLSYNRRDRRDQSQRSKTL